MSGYRNAHRKEIRFRVLRRLEECPETSQRDRSEAVGPSAGEDVLRARRSGRPVLCEAGQFRGCGGQALR